MKIMHLYIQNYKQFRELELDLTYPTGHEKARKPLDKICIIGQSGTGKTNLLEIIAKSTVDFSSQPTNSYLPFSLFTTDFNPDGYIMSGFSVQNKNTASTFFTRQTSKIDMGSNNSLSDEEKSYFVSATRQLDFDEEVGKDEIDTTNMSHSDKVLIEKLTNAKAELTLESINKHKKSYMEEVFQYTSPLSVTNKFLEPKKKTAHEKRIEVDRAIKEIEERYVSVSKSLKQLKWSNFLDRRIVNIGNRSSDMWAAMKKRIDNYQSERRSYIEQLANKLVNDINYTKEYFIQDIEKWGSENENLLEKISDDINSIIKRFNLELTKIDENQKDYNGLTVRDLSNNVILQYDDLSTGTKNLLSTFIPLKAYAPQNSIILIDEPENSFYPDIQRQLADLYMSVGDNNQLVFATHSPLVASSFEPWEVVELKFDQNNQIYREKYYEGENHVDNYLKDPRLLTWTGILTDIFDLKEDSNFTFREEALMKYIRLERELKEVEDKNVKKEKFEALMKLSDLLGLSGNEKD